MSRSTFLFVLLSLLASLSLIAARSSRFKPGRYFEIGQKEYADGLISQATIPGKQPQQIYTTLGSSPSSITVTWVTFNMTDSGIEWGVKPNQYSYLSLGETRKFVDPNLSHVVRYMHTVRLTNLKPKLFIYYRVGSNQSGWSDELEFVMPPMGDELLTMIIYGDTGVVNARSMQQVIAEVEANSAQMVLHMGDYAYNLDTNNGSYGDIFMNNIQPIASRVPYLGCQGNHESAFNATHYTERLSAMADMGVASGSNSNWWFSWDFVSGGAKIHLVAINTEMYYSDDYKQQRADQYKWIDNDLTQASKDADWLIVYGHRPMYCSDSDSDDCMIDATILREGYGDENNGMDEMISKHKVDIYFTAHEHSYERTYPVSHGNIDFQPLNHTYVNPQHPVHIITGSAGCQEELDAFDDVNFAAWSVIRSATYGYGHLIVHNATHLYWDQLLDEGRQGTDVLWIVKDKQTVHDQVTVSRE